MITHTSVTESLAACGVGRKEESGTFRRRRFGAAVSALDNSALDISAPGLFGAKTFFFRFVVLKLRYFDL